MAKMWFLAIGLVTVCVVPTWAVDVSTKKLFIKDHASDPAKRVVQVQSKDGGVQLSGAGDPGTNGAALHVYSATDDFCAILPAGSGWESKPTKWKFKNKATKTSALIQDGKLLVTVKSGVTYTLNDDGTQGVVNAQVQFGTGTRYCLRCTGNKKDIALKFVGKDCAPAACAPEPSPCNPPGVTTTSTTTSGPTTLAPTTLVTTTLGTTTLVPTTIVTTTLVPTTTVTTTSSVPTTIAPTTTSTSTVTTTSATTSLVPTTTSTSTVTTTSDTLVPVTTTSTSTTTSGVSTSVPTTTIATTTIATTTLAPTTTSSTSTTLPAGILGALTATPGRFNYNLMVGLPGANAACNTNFPGTHACTYAELQAAEAAGELDGLKDTGNNTVTSFWAIDSSQPGLQQCIDDGGGSGLNWEYGTAHTASRAQKVALTNATGVLGPLQSNLQCNFSTGWVGCCL